MTHSQQISLLNKIALYAIFFIFGAIVFSQCNSCGTVKPINHSELGNKIKLLNQKSKQLAHKNDSLQSIKQPLLIRYKTIRKEVLINIHDTLNVLHFVNTCDSIVTLDSTLLVNCYDRISVKDSIINEKDVVIYNKDVELKEALKSNKKYWKGVKVGFVAGVILTESANIGVKLIK